MSRINADSLAARRRPAEDRMEQAAALLATWRGLGFSPEFHLGPARVTDPLQAKTMPCPSYLKPEMAWLLRDVEALRREAWAHVMPQSVSGGAA